MCFEVHWVVYQGLCCIWAGQGVGGAEEQKNLPSSLMAFFNIHVIDIFTTY